MDKINRIELIENNKDYNKMLLNLGYLSPHIYKDLELLKAYFDLKKFDYNNYEIHIILSDKFKLQPDTIKKKILKLTKLI